MTVQYRFRKSDGSVRVTLCYTRANVLDPDLRGEVEQSIVVEMTTLVDAFRRDTAEYIETVTDEKNRRAEQRSDVLNLPQHVRRVLERRV